MGKITLHSGVWMGSASSVLTGLGSLAVATPCFEMMPRPVAVDGSAPAD
jgi:hypothetical protein